MSSAAQTAEASAGLSDLQFTARYRVPFQFSRRVRESLKGGNFVASSSGSTLTDLDGNVLYDLTGSYGVNVFGNDFYQECMAAGVARAQELGPVLGALHPCVADNVERQVDWQHRCRLEFASIVRHKVRFPLRDNMVRIAEFAPACEFYFREAVVGGKPNNTLPNCMRK